MKVRICLANLTYLKSGKRLSFANLVKKMTKEQQVMRYILHTEDCGRIYIDIHYLDRSFHWMMHLFVHATKNAIILVTTAYCTCKILPLNHAFWT